jgi:hypothetical protein
MLLQDQVQKCSNHYQKWKDLALNSLDPKESKRCMEKAFFWLELQTAFITLFAIEQTKGKDVRIKRKLIEAKTNLSKKLADYAKQTLDEMNP